MRRALIAAVLVAVAAIAPAAQEVARPTDTLAPDLALATQYVADVTGDGAEDVILVGSRGEVRVWSFDAKAKPAAMAKEAVGSFVLPDPKRTLLAVGDVLGTGGAPQLVVLSGKAVSAHCIGKDGGFDAVGVVLFRLPRRAPFALRIGEPRFSRIVSDLNGDGRLDVLVPGPEAIRIWLSHETEAGMEFVHAASVRTDLKSSRSWSDARLSEQYESAFRIPYLALQDVNGDERPDLMVIDGSSRAFHLQREDGSFPEQPDRVLDLSIFKDTTVASSIRPGRTLAGSQRQSLTMSDIDDDGMPDYVISHRRKIWTFYGSEDGPNFVKPTQVLSTAEDVSAFLVLPLDEDPFPDLLLLRVQVPSITAIVGGLFSELSVEISATGYRSEAPEKGKKGRAFSRLPNWKGAVEVRLPAITEMIRNPQALISRFEATASKFRSTVEADFNGDGTDDVAMLSEARDRIDVWEIEKRPESEADLIGLHSLFFTDKKRVWTLDDVLAKLGGIAEERTRQLTGGEPPTRTLRLRPSRYEFRKFEAADVRGDGRHAVVVSYQDRGAAGGAVVDVYR